MFNEINELSFDEKVCLMALSVIQERVKAIPAADRDDLFVLLREFLTTEDDEPRESAALAITEIVERSRGTVRHGNLADGEPSKWLEFISKRIRDLRKQAGMTQDELADRGGLTQSHLSRLEKGDHSPNGATLAKLARALGVPDSTFQPVVADGGA